MGYYMRFISIDKEDISLSVLESALRLSDTDYRINNDGDILYKGEIYGQLEVNRPGDSLYGDEIEELKEFIEEARGAKKKKQRVLAVLDNSSAIVAVGVLWQELTAEETLERLEPLWDWLLANRKGLIQADDEGYYDATGLILKVE
ncbi:MAG: hypothetical protein L0220_32160 [Acidobacteria bacterium]|nr:hypothetical protein [Acidobacteriota bacterium]